MIIGIAPAAAYFCTFRSAKTIPVAKAKKAPAPAEGISLNKYISDTGFCSRREADTYIGQARVTINDQVAVPGNRVLDGDVVEVDGEPIARKVKTIYIAYHKPQGITSTTDTKDKTNIVDAIRHPQRIFPIGRLDKDSEGLIFLTNDGNIVNKILRAGNRHEKEYIVTVDKPHTPEFIRNMAAGVRLGADGWTLPCKVQPLSKTSFRIILTQGLNRQIRRMCEALDFKVTRLKRVRIMNVTLGNLPLGHWRPLTPDEVQVLQGMISSSTGTEEASAIKKARPAKPVSPPPQPKEAAKKPAPKEKKEQRPDPVPSKKKSSYKSFRERRK